MTAYTPKELIAATVRANNCQDFPLEAVPATAAVLRDAVAPAYETLPAYLQTDTVHLALKTVFAMGVAAGIELRAGS